MAFNFVFNKIWDTLWFCVLYSLICSTSVISSFSKNPWNAHMDEYLNLPSVMKPVLKDGVFGKWNDCFYKMDFKTKSYCFGECIPIINGEALLGDSPARCESSLNKSGEKDKQFWGNFFNTPGEVSDCVKFFEVPDCILKKSGSMAFSISDVVNEAVVPSICGPVPVPCNQVLIDEAEDLMEKVCYEDPDCSGGSNEKDKCCGTALYRCCVEGQWEDKYE